MNLKIAIIHDVNHLYISLCSGAPLISIGYHAFKYRHTLDACLAPPGEEGTQGAWDWDFPWMDAHGNAALGESDLLTPNWSAPLSDRAERQASRPIQHGAGAVELPAALSFSASSASEASLRKVRSRNRMQHRNGFTLYSEGTVEVAFAAHSR